MSKRNILTGLAVIFATPSPSLGQALPILGNDYRNVVSLGRIKNGQAEETLEGNPATWPPDAGVTTPAATAGQWENLSVFGGWKTLHLRDTSGTLLAGSPDGGLAGATGPTTLVRPSFTPVDPSGNPVAGQGYQIGSVVVGRPLVLRAVTFPLGWVLQRPDRLPDGSPTDPEAYLPRPANSESDDFYWSRHAEKVFATKPGSITVVWELRVPQGEETVFAQNYVISGTPVDPPKKIFWTEQGFDGPLVEVPGARVGEVNIIYNALFEEVVPEGQDYRTLNDPPLPPSGDDPPVTPPAERRTLWHDSIDNRIHAYNREGRVFIEYLGNLRGVDDDDEDLREHLGFEIVDVIQEIPPGELVVDLGEPVLPPDADPELTATVVAGLGASSDPYLYEHRSLGGTKSTLYAIKETEPLFLFDLDEDGELDPQQSNEVLIYWKEKGTLSIEWPKYYTGYILQWPEARADYAIYARPEAGADDLATGVQLNSADNPALVYQDDLTRQHAELTDQKLFVSSVSESDPDGRALLRFTRDEEIYFERVLSERNTTFDRYTSNLRLRANVGERIAPPGAADQMVGYIRPTSGDAYDPRAYLDPFVHGFAEAGRGAIIPVNAEPGNDELEVWWYQRSAASAGNTAFSATYWPSVVVVYKLQWPPPLDAPVVLPAQPAESITALGEYASYENRDDGLPLRSDRSDVTFSLRVDLDPKPLGPAEALWESGGGGTGFSLTYEAPSTLALHAVGGGNILKATYPVPPEALAAGPLDLAWTFDVDAADEPGGGQAIELLVNGITVARATGSTAPDWTGGNLANLGRVGNDLPGYPGSGSFSFLTYEQDFGAANGTQNLGDGSTIASTDGKARVVGGALRMTDASTNNTRSSFRLPPGIDASRGFDASFRFSITDSEDDGRPPADGFSFNYGSIQPYAVPGEVVPGLTAEHYQGHGIAGVDLDEAGLRAFIDSRAPNVGPFLAPAIAWGDGSEFPAYFPEVDATFGPGLPLGALNSYAVHMTGEILIPESGTYQFKDGVDDYTYFAIDGDVLIDDNDWTDPDGNSNGGSPIVSRTFGGVPPEGLWLPVEFIMAEGNGGDAGVMMWDYDHRAPAGRRLGANANFPAVSTSPAARPLPAIPTQFFRTTAPEGPPTASSAHGHAEEGFGSGLSVEFDTWRPGDGEHGYNVAVDRADVPGGALNTDLPVDGEYHTAEISWRPAGGGTLTLRVDGRDVFTDLATPGFTPTRDDNFAFAARTGGATETLLIDDLKLSLVRPADFASGTIDLATGLSFYPGIRLERPAAVADTDVDGLDDFWESTFSDDLGLLARGRDTDGDDLPDEIEFALRTDPTRADTDGDGVLDSADDNTIVMARNDGSGDLGVAASGEIYRQPDPALPGYNPNEEHAIVSGGVAWALRDDLNVAGSSRPYVLVSYQAPDGRPAMRVFKVERENAVHTFTYDGLVGKPLQAPAPLPFMPLPIDEDGVLFNAEVEPPAPVDPPTNFDPARDDPLEYYNRFTYEDRKGATWIYRALHVEPPLAAAGLLAATAVEGEPFGYVIHSNRVPAAVSFTAAGLPNGLLQDGNMIAGTPDDGSAGDYTVTLTLVSGEEMVEADLELTVVAAGGAVVTQGPQGSLADATNSFTMHYYYKTEAEFDFPGLPANPPVGTIVPYLRAVDTANEGAFLDDPVAGPPLEIRFMPQWPRTAPVLNVAETLALPKKGLPAVRGQTSVRILYEQSRAADMDAAVPSARLIDPEVAKKFFLAEKMEEGLDQVPGSANTSLVLGRTFFPDLPPHLSQRFYVNPNEGEHGALVLEGEFVDEVLGEDYFLLNVLSDDGNPPDQDDDPENDDEVDTLKKLVAGDDDRKAAWDAAIDALAATLLTFTPDPQKPSTFRADPSLEVEVTASEAAELPSQDTAVVSYALSASGGGTGFVVLATGDGSAFTPPGESVSLHVFKVGAPLYRGELKTIASANPLDEKITFQHSGDYAGRPTDYEFAWLIGQPVDGDPPLLYTFARQLVLGDGTWRLLQNPPGTFAEFRSFEADDTGPGWSGVALPANQVTVDDGNGGENHGTLLPNALLRRNFAWTGPRPIELYLSLGLEPLDGAVVYLNFAEVASWNVPGRADSVPAGNPGEDFDPLPRVFRIPAGSLLEGTNTVTVQLYTGGDAGAPSSFNLRLEGSVETENLSAWQTITTGAKDPAVAGATGKNRHTIGGSGIATLTDNYLTMRYRAVPGTPAFTATGGEWSRWMPPQLAEGWIKRVLRGINPFDQRITDLLNNEVDTEVSLVAQAGPRWEGDIALSLQSIGEFGLIEIYETVLNRGKDLSIDGNPPLNVPAANDALLLAAGYLNDLYMILGNEATADALNPTIAFDTDGGDFGEFNTSLFAFRGQVASVLEEELALLRGRDDTFQPGVEVMPLYNRLPWNYTLGINSGQPIYALNYNIRDLDGDGTANAADAAALFPQGHGDAYGHYLTALTGYYRLLRDPHFSWKPRIEAVSVLGQPVSVDFQDERKFAAAAGALARTAGDVTELTYRQQFTSDTAAGWGHLRDGETNARTGRTREWGTDDWASRGGQGALFNWITANSLLPPVDPDPGHEGIRKIDRTTVPELDQIVGHAGAIQQVADQADARLNPLGLAAGALTFDISPSGVDEGKTHFEQVYERAVDALGNAVFAFDNAKGSTRFLRQQENSLDGQRNAIAEQERAFETRLIEIYGTPYADDIGPGKTWEQGYAGPDLVNFSFVDRPELFTDPAAETETFTLFLDAAFVSENSGVLNFSEQPTVTYTLNAFGEVVKPADWRGRRAHPGQLQTAFSNFLAARHRVRQAVQDYNNLEGDMSSLINLYKAAVQARGDAVRLTGSFDGTVDTLEAAILAANITSISLNAGADDALDLGEAIAEFFPKSVGFSNDVTSAGRGGAKLGAAIAKTVLRVLAITAEGTALGLEDRIAGLERQLDIDLESAAWASENQQLIADLQNALSDYLTKRDNVDLALRGLDQAARDLQALKSRGIAVQLERKAFRNRASAIVQGLRVRDFALRAFRDEALEKYGALFDLAARYAFLAARAYDYETGLLDASGSSSARGFFDQVVQARALGVVDGQGQPQFSASDTGDPGLAGVLARMNGDWAVAKTRLGFNNPDRYRTLFSLREENFRIVPGEGGDGAWRDKLAACTLDNLLDDPDVRRYCLQIEDPDGLAVPGLVIPFQTTIAQGFNFFGRPLAGGDNAFSPTSFATKIRASGIAFDGYIGMDAPTALAGPLGGIGAVTPPDPVVNFNDPRALASTPYIYLVPAGVDSMRSPPLGDVSTVRSWTVEDQAIPLPFNIGNTDFSTRPGFISAETLSEPAFTLRKHQAFRAVPAGTVFSAAPGFTNARLIGRSVWNSQWKLVIPGNTLLNDPQRGLQVFNDTVRDIELFLETYSYSGN